MQELISIEDVIEATVTCHQVTTKDNSFIERSSECVKCSRLPFAPRPMFFLETLSEPTMRVLYDLKSS